VLGRFRLAISVFILAVPFAAFAGEPIAVMVALKGKIQVTPTGGTAAQKAVLGRTLERGDKVAVGSGGSVTLFFNDGNVIELGEKSTITVGGKMGNNKAAAASVSGDVFKGVTKFVASGSSGSGRIGLAPMRGGQTADAGALIREPRRTKVTGSRPSFAWGRLEGATRYRVSLTGDDGAIWKRETPDTSISFPADASELAPGEYLWELEAFGASGSLRREETWFHVLDPSEADQVASHLKEIDKAAAGSAEAAHYVAGSYLFDRGLVQDAAHQFEALCRLTPEAPGAHEALGNAYRAVGLTDQAAAEYQKALTLSRTP
jgi:hypothetical protein